MNNLWNDILIEIESKISKPIFFTFFRKSELISLIDSTAIIDVPTDIGAEYLEKRYSLMIKSEFEKKTGKIIKLIFTQQNNTTILKQ